MLIINVSYKLKFALICQALDIHTSFFAMLEHLVLLQHHVPQVRISLYVSLACKHSWCVV